MPYLSGHPTTADAVPLPSKEGRFTVYKRRRFPICAPPPSPRAKPVPPEPLRRRRYPSPAGRSPLISHFTAYSCQLTAYRESAALRHPSCGFAAALLQGPACQGLPQLRRIPVTIHISAAKPLSNLMSPVRSTCSTVGPAKRCPTCHPYAPYIGLAGAPKT